MPSAPLINYLKQTHNISLTPSQLEAVHALNGPTCVISCPGSGKTTVTVIRLANLIYSGNIAPEHILALTFSKASAIDMNQRFAKLFPKLSQQVKFATIHSFAFQIIKTYQQMTSFSYQFVDSRTNPTIQSKYILSKLYLEITETYPSDDEIELIKNQISLLKNLMIEPHHIKEIKQKIENDVDLFLNIYNKYEQFKEKNFLLDYDDMLTYSYLILKNNPQILSYYQTQYTHIQVDEAQDTSKIQFELIKLLLSKEQNLFLVGDDDQSIYSFRGAYPQQLLDFKQTFDNASLIYMSENFRSSQDIVNTSATFISKNKNRYIKDIKTSNKASSPVKCLEFRSEKEQLAYLISKLKDIHPDESIAVLYRQNVSAIPLIESFERFGLSFKLNEGRLNFFSHFIVKDFLAFYKLARNGYDLEAFKRLSKVLYLSATVSNQATTQITTTYLDFITRYVEFPKAFQRDKIRHFHQQLPKLLTLSPDQSIEFILKTLDYRAYLIKKGVLKDDDHEFNYTQGLAVIETLKMIARNESTIDRFLSRIDHLQEICLREQTHKGISLMTFHASKGLEFDHVFLVDCMNGITPPQTVLNDFHQQKIEDYEEEARLFYVGMTRAKSRVEILSVAFKHNTTFTPSNYFQVIQSIVNPNQMDTATSSKKLSRHVSELKERLLCHIDLSLFTTGTPVSHKIFGEGFILSLDGEIATIQFDKDIKRISLRITLQNETLKLIQTTSDINK